MRTTFMASATAAIVLSLTGCGEIHRNNDLFSMAIVQPATSAPAATAPAIPATAPTPLSRAASASPRSTPSAEPDVGVASARNGPAGEMRPSRVDVTESRSAAQTAGRVDENENRATATLPIRGSVDSAASESGDADRAQTQTAALDASERENLPRPTLRASAARESQARSQVAGAAAAEDGPRVATSGQIVAGMLRTWNKIAVPGLSSKVLFGVWPEEVDGDAPDAVELAKRGVLAAPQ